MSVSSGNSSGSDKKTGSSMSTASGMSHGGGGGGNSNGNSMHVSAMVSSVARHSLSQATSSNSLRMGNIN